jgi:Na+-transporting NADH:ubiquinone oxidoreductase subunit C
MYTIGFSAAVCIVCSLLVSTSAVGLKDRQQQNAILEKQKNVLMAAGLVDPTQSVTRQEVAKLFENIKPVVINLQTGNEDTDIDPDTFDQLKATKDPLQSIKAPENKAKIARIPNNALIYKVLKNGKVQKIVLPIEGKGLWSTLYGFIALGTDCNTIQGITFYQHGETPGLGGEVDNPKWKALWIGRKAFDQDGNLKITVIKGKAGPVEKDPHQVDGLSGATLTARGVSHLVQFWLGDNGFSPFFEKFRNTRSQ